MTESTAPLCQTLVLGYGNPGRKDDGLGPALIRALEQRPPADVVLDADYQLTVENAWDLAQYRRAVLVDATVEGEAPFYFRPLEPTAPMSFSTHSVSPGAVLQLARDLFQADPEVYVLGIRGYQFEEIAEGLTPRAQNNCTIAERFLRERLASGDFSAY